MPTIKDVAREAGVSVGTVSRYLNGAVLKEQNQRRIDAAVARLGYRRNALARSMKTGRSMLVGVIVPALSNMFSMRVIEGVEHALEAHGFSVLVADSGGDAAREREKVARAHGGRVGADALRRKRARHFAGGGQDARGAHRPGNG